MGRTCRERRRSTISAAHGAGPATSTVGARKVARGVYSSCFTFLQRLPLLPEEHRCHIATVRISREQNNTRRSRVGEMKPRVAVECNEQNSILQTLPENSIMLHL